VGEREGSLASGASRNLGVVLMTSTDVVLRQGKLRTAQIGIVVLAAITPHPAG
jgi:hypothetical protein